jgi:CheY-like chemotaxis protein
MLARIGCLVSTAGSGSEAEQAVSVQEFDLAVLDLQLPDTDGMRLAHRLRITIPSATLVLFSANILLTDLEQWSSSDLDLILSKPISLDDLAEVCARSGSTDRTDGSEPEIERPDPRHPPVEITARHRELLEEYLHESLFAYGRQDIEACAGQVHKITSAAGALQLTELVALARSAEETARTDSRVALFDALRRLAREYRVTLGIPPTSGQAPPT